MKHMLRPIRSSALFLISEKTNQKQHYGYSSEPAGYRTWRLLLNIELPNLSVYNTYFSEVRIYWNQTYVILGYIAILKTILQDIFS